MGLTGGIGSGKSTVARLFAELGAAIVDADQLARDAVAKGTAGLRRIVERFGPAVLAGDGGLDRKALAAIVFNDPDARKDLEHITHPVVAALAAARIAELSSTHDLVLYDVPLFFENDLARFFPEVIVVDAPEEVRIARIAARDGLDEPAIRARLEAQLSLSEKVARATWVIDNGQSTDRTRAQVEELHRELVRSGTNGGTA
ncbi:MAG: dephospho-CoA kinase [Deltaproteobacteria bacterium]|nr:dephospho-CoA kinase [Deltaproteobacteria bacterium]